ncbi:haloacid dehalogenase-like hydrolase [Desulfobacter latus]|uniref:Haloacid dehalogenase-like hydrolase n=1 Tax=Desulfobacter latus TaxID=2292 RepID=A0A850T1K0_9BACT|nr:haloacid dehalogenase-like hydrolase [Desulfobacter latus]NWH04971.1 haloacid dehalogenase-like hydrolase [Desulfobacter latus]
MFNVAGIEKKIIPKTLPYGKHHVRSYLRQNGNEEEWIKLQGYVYGKKLNEAFAYDGVKPFISYCEKENIEYCIISHKTRYPYSGPAYDLHQSARDWLIRHNLQKNIFFELTKEEKIERIAEQKCTHFIDDLPEFLTLPGFPENLTRILFNPFALNLAQNLPPDIKIMQSWKEIQSMMEKETGLKKHSLFELNTENM